MFQDYWKNSGVSFIYRELSSWQDLIVPSNGVLHETSFSAPTSILCNAVLLFSNSSDSHFCYVDASKNKYELPTNSDYSYTSGVFRQSKLMGFNTFCPNIQQFYIQID